MRKIVGDYTGLLIFFLAVPLKLLGDIAAYLFGLPVPSMTAIALPFVLISIILLPIKVSSQDRIGFSLICFFFFSFFCILAVNIIFYHNSLLDAIILNAVFTSVLMYLILFFSGIYYFRFEKIIFSTLFFIVVTVSILIIFTQLYLKDVWQQLNESGSYLRIADIYALISLMVISRLKSLILILSLIVMVSLTLLYIGSRSSLMFFLVSIIFYIFYLIVFLKVSSQFITAIVFFLFSMAIFFVLSDSASAVWGLLQTQFSDTRIGYTVESSTGGGADTRANFFHIGLDRIYSNPFSGNIYERVNGGIGGEYIHNILFLWDDFGIFVFGLIMALIIWLLVKTSSDKNTSYLLMPILFCLLSMLFARAYAFPYIFLFFGIYLSSYYKFNRVESNSLNI